MGLGGLSSHSLHGGADADDGEKKDRTPVNSTSSVCCRNYDCRCVSRILCYAFRAIYRCQRAGRGGVSECDDVDDNDCNGYPDIMNRINEARVDAI